MEKLSKQAQENYDKAISQMREKELADENLTSMDGILKPLK